MWDHIYDKTISDSTIWYVCKCTNDIKKWMYNLLWWVNYPNPRCGNRAIPIGRDSDFTWGTWAQTLCLPESTGFWQSFHARDTRRALGIPGASRPSEPRHSPNRVASSYYTTELSFPTEISEVCVCGTNERMRDIYRVPWSVPRSWRGGIRGGVPGSCHVVDRPTDSTQPPLPSVEYILIRSLLDIATKSCPCRCHSGVGRPWVGRPHSLLGQSGMGFGPHVPLGLYRSVVVSHLVFGEIFPFGPLKSSKLQFESLQWKNTKTMELG
jgi:hypothetical protein